MISVKNIYKSFGKLEVLKNVSCTITAGEQVAIIGPSGSGKSTLLRCMNLLEIPTRGEIWLEESIITEIDPYLHPALIRASKTYAALMRDKGITLTEGQEPDSEADAAAIAEICQNRLLKKHEGKAFRALLAEMKKQLCIDVNLARRDMGMVFQHFNLFNNMTVLKNLTLAPRKVLK